jgi:beta-lactamase superfamily II metal-dependent hydrolase
VDPEQIEPLEAVIVDVGHGNAAIVRDGSTCAVIDAPAKDALFDELYRCDVTSIRHLVLSHSDVDHMGGASRLLWDRRFAIGTVWCNSDGLKNTQAWRHFAQQLNIRHRAGEVGVEMTLNTAANTRLCFGRIKVEILHPDVEMALLGPTRNRTDIGSLDANRVSAVVRISLNDHPAVLFTADIDSVGLSRMLSQGTSLRAPVLVFPHHGGHAGRGPDRAFAQRICNQVQPNLVVFSMERGGPFTKPSPEVIAGVRETVPDAHIACTQLSRHCHSGNIPDVVGPLTMRSSAGRDSNSCCAGTLAVSWKSHGLSYEPPLTSHKAFVDRVVGGAMCGLGTDIPGPRTDSRANTTSAKAGSQS